MKILVSCVFILYSLYANDLKDINTFEASFKQSIINSSNKEIVYNGYIYIKEPANIVWKYTQPILKDVYIINTKVTIVEPELEQVIMSKMDKEINILKLLKNATKVTSNKYVSSIDNRNYTLTITNNTLQQINYTDEIDNKVTIYFSDIQQNHTIKENIFKFTIPYEYDIIKK